MWILAITTLAPQLDPVPLLSTGDQLFPGETIEILAGHDVADDGSWLSIIRTDAKRQHLVVDGQVVVTQREPAPWDPSRTVRGIQGASKSTGGKYAYVTGTTPTLRRSVIVQTTEVVIEEDPVPLFLGLPSGTEWGYLDRTVLVQPDLLAVVCQLNTPASPTYEAVVLLDLGPNDQAINGRVAIAEGDTLSDGTQLNSLNLSSVRLSSSGEVIWAGATFSPIEGVVGISRDVIARQGQPSPLPGTTWSLSGGTPVDMNASGNWVITANIRETATGFERLGLFTDEGLVARSQLAHQALPGRPAVDFGFGPPMIDGSGGVSFFANVGTPPGGAPEEVWVTRDFVAALEGVTTVNGDLITGFVGGSRNAISHSESGQYMLVTATTDDATNGGSTFHILRIESPVNDVFCTSNPNSTGRRGVCSVGGSDRVLDNELRVSASQLPRQTFGLFAVSLDAGFTPDAGGSQGNLCLSGSIGRYAPSSSGPLGVLRLDVDLNAVSAPTGTFAATAGQTLRFQAWHRDVDPGVTSNFTNAVAVTLR